MSLCVGVSLVCLTNFLMISKLALGRFDRAIVHCTVLPKVYCGKVRIMRKEVTVLVNNINRS